MTPTPNDKSCKCACHDKRITDALNRGMEHADKCCEQMNGTMDDKQSMEERLEATYSMCVTLPGKNLAFYDYLLPAIKSEISLALAKHDAELQQRISMLRQWLNEKPADKMVTNEEIKKWLLPSLSKNKKK